MVDLVAKGMAPIEQLLERLSVNTVFGEPVQEGDVTVVPVADVVLGFGYGFGQGSKPCAGEDAELDEAEPTEGPDSSGGGGGGAGGRATPRGYIRITKDSVAYKPIVDEGRLAIAGMALGAWSVFWITATIRSLAASKRR